MSVVHNGVKFLDTTGTCTESSWLTTFTLYHVVGLSTCENSAVCRAPRLLISHGLYFDYSRAVIVIVQQFNFRCYQRQRKTAHYSSTYIWSAFFFCDFTHHTGFDNILFQIPIYFSKQLMLQILDRQKWLCSCILLLFITSKSLFNALVQILPMPMARRFWDGFLSDVILVQQELKFALPTQIKFAFQVTHSVQHFQIWNPQNEGQTRHPYYAPILYTPCV